MHIVFASANKNKIQEISALIPSTYKLVSLEDIGITEDIPETGLTIKDNSEIKARYVAEVLIKKLKEKNIGILITDHNVHETLNITDRAYLLYSGSVIKSGTAEDLANDEQVRKVYLGENFELRR